MDISSLITPVMQGLGVEPKPDPARLAAIQGAIQTEQDPYMQELLKGSKPVDSMPGFYWNEKEKLLLEYHPTTGDAPRILQLDLPTQKSKTIIDKSLLK